MRLDSYHLLLSISAGVYPERPPPLPPSPGKQIGGGEEGNHVVLGMLHYSLGHLVLFTVR